jgi:hypothetical protein
MTRCRAWVLLAGWYWEDGIGWDMELYENMQCMVLGEEDSKWEALQ